MKTEEKLKAVTDDIRNKLPRLMKLEKGCLIDVEYTGMWEIVSCEFIHNEAVYSVINEFSETIEIRKADILKIIGKEPTILDCLEWIKLVQPKSSWSSYAIIMDGRLVDTFAEKTICKVDLSKPYIKDQSEELVNFLYGLL